MKPETNVEALVDALTDAIRDPPTGEGATWMNAEQARACPRCAGDKRARHIYPTCARTALLAAIRDREQRARGKGWLAGAIAVYLHEGRTHDRAEHAAHWLYGRALSEREEG